MRSAACHGKRWGRLYMTVIFPSFPRRPCKGETSGTLWAAISGISVRKLNYRKHLGDLSYLRCDVPVVLLHGTADSEVPYGAMVETVKGFPMPASSNWRGKNTHLPQSRTD